MRRYRRIEDFNLALISINLRLLLLMFFSGLLPCTMLQGQSDFMHIGNMNKQNPNAAEDAGNYLLPSVVDDEYLNFQPDILQPKNNAVANYALRLDSIVELRSEGFITTSARWHYYYNTSSQPDSVVTRYYNQFDILIPRIEKRSYNSSGNLIRYVYQQLDPWRTYLYDSTLIDFYVEDYFYLNGKLVKTLSTSHEYSQPQVEEHHYYYDTDGLVIQDIRIYGGDTSSYMDYYYYPDGSLNYEVEHYVSDYLIRKFTYFQTDTSKLTINQWRLYYGIPEQPLLDTVSGWFTETYYYETFDESRRRTSMLVEQYGPYIEAEGKVYKAGYSYNDSDHSVHVSYYNWIGTEEEDLWKEVLRIDIAYDDEGNPLTYEKDFYDARTGSWEIENRKDYYYSLALVAITDNDIPEGRLKIFPNPAADVLYIKADMAENANYSIYTLTGINVMMGDLTNQSLDISRLQSGIYILEISNDSHLFSGMFFKY